MLNEVAGWIGLDEDRKRVVCKLLRAMKAKNSIYSEEVARDRLRSDQQRHQFAEAFSVQKASMTL